MGDTPRLSTGLAKTHGLYATAYAEALTQDRATPSPHGLANAAGDGGYRALEARHRGATGAYSSFLEQAASRTVLVPRGKPGSPAGGFEARQVTPETASRLEEAEAKHRAAMQRHLDAMNRHMKVVESCKPSYGAGVAE